MAVCLAGLAGAIGIWFAGVRPAEGAQPETVAASFVLTGGGQPIPASFLGLSIEYNTLLTYEREGRLFTQVSSLIRPEDGAPMVLRVGGKSADHTLWEPAGGAPVPKGVDRIGAGWLARLAQLVAEDHVNVVLDLNLAVHSPTMEAAFAAAAENTLPRGTLIGLEIGNEPDLYFNQPELEEVRTMSSTGVPADWTTGYSAADYRRDYIAYAQTLSQEDPGIPLGGPEIISNKQPWLNGISGLGRLDPSFITIHRYAASNCFSPTSRYYPSIPELLSERASAGLAGTVASAVRFAHAHDAALRLDEVNSISCGGNHGVADTFATALWAPDALMEAVQAGVDGVSWHIRPDPPNAPFHPISTTIDGQTTIGIEAMPELYGLALFAQMTLTGAELMHGELTAAKPVALKVWATRFTGGTRVLVINKGPTPSTVTLHLGVSGPAYLRRLLAPGVGATAGVTYAGQTIGANGHWQGKLQTPSVPGQAGQYTVTVPGYSAATVTVWHADQSVGRPGVRLSGPTPRPRSTR